MKSAVTWMIVPCLAVLGAAHAMAPAEGTAAPASKAPKMQREELEEMSATVISVDAATRVLGLRGTDGATAEFEVSPIAKNFAQIKVGDEVVVSYYRGIVAEVKPAGTVSDAVDRVDLTTVARPGEKPAAGAASSVRATVVVEGIDTKSNTLTFRRPDGTSRTLPIESPEGREFIRKLHKGDKVDVVYAEAVAIEVRPKAGAKPKP